MQKLLIFSKKFEIGLAFFVFVDPLNISLKSKMFSKLATPLGIM
jgi:hypothetical protein